MHVSTIRPPSNAQRQRTIPTNNLGDIEYPLTPASPTTPIAYPAAIPVAPTLNPAAKCSIPENSE